MQRLDIDVDEQTDFLFPKLGIGEQMRLVKGMNLHFRISDRACCLIDFHPLCTPTILSGEPLIIKAT